MEGRRWEELDQDCLVNVFEKVGDENEGFETLLVDIPFVCKSWYKASLNPKCRVVLDLSILHNPSFVRKYIERFGIKKFSSTKFMDLVARRSSYAASLVLPSDCTVEVLDCFSAECPSVKYLRASITNLTEEHVNFFAETVCKFKFLQFLDLNRFLQPIDAILAKISVNCENFNSLFTRGTITLQEASAIATYIPKIKFLSLKGAGLYPDALLHIIRGCRELLFLDISDCVGVDIDEEILKEVTHMKHFHYRGCRKELSDEQVNWLTNWFEEWQWKKQDSALGL